MVSAGTAAVVTGATERERDEAHSLFICAAARAQRRKARLQAKLDACACKTGTLADTIRTAIGRADSDIDFLRRLADDAAEGEG